MKVSEGYHGSGNVVTVESPVYLIEFWTRVAEPDSGEQWSLDEYELTNCEATEPLEWAGHHKPVDSKAVVYACQRQPAGSPSSDVHILLVGTDPSSNPSRKASLSWSPRR
jgi:hypothetical protein